MNRRIDIRSDIRMWRRWVGDTVVGVAVGVVRVFGGGLRVAEGAAREESERIDSVDRYASLKLES